MYIHKIIEITNCGKILSLDKKNSNWNHTFSKINSIYAPNGSGKTTLSIIFDSLNYKNELLTKKKTINSTSEQTVKISDENNKQFIFSKGQWNRYDSNIEVFNSLYLEENTYYISISTSLNKLNIFEKYNEEKIVEINNKIIHKNIELQKIRTKVQNSKHYYKKVNKDYLQQKTYIDAVSLRDKIASEISELNKSKLNLYQDSVKKYTLAINKYLELFTANIKIIDIKIVKAGKDCYNLIYGITIGSNTLTIEERNKLSLKYVLSDGDKNALGLSFFLAKFDIIKDIDQYLVVIDDPFTSFDSQRKVTTLFQLARLANKVKQFILLTHDMHFAYDFSKKYSTSPIKNLIIHSRNTFCIDEYNIEVEMLTGLAKDLYVLRNYKDNTNNDQFYLREVCRCIRPVLEGIFRMKYSNYIKENQWLGDFIDLIRNSNVNEPFYRLKENLPELIELNDYSKIYHHSNPNFYEMTISEIELSNMVKRTLKLVEIL